MIRVCAACMCVLQQPSLFVLSAEQRTVFQTIISPDVNIAELQHLKLLVCINCLRQVKLVQAFQQKALRGAKNLIMLYKKIALQLMQNTIQVKQELDPLASTPRKKYIIIKVPKQPELIKKEPQDVISEELSSHARDIKQNLNQQLSEELVIKKEPEADNNYTDMEFLEPDYGETDIRESTMQNVQNASTKITERQVDVQFEDFEVLTHRKLSENQSKKLTFDAANVSPVQGANTRTVALFDKTLPSSTTRKKYIVRKVRIPHPVARNLSNTKESQQARKKKRVILSDTQKQEVVDTYKRLYEDLPNNVCTSRGLINKIGVMHGISGKQVCTILKANSSKDVVCRGCDKTISSNGFIGIHNMLTLHTESTRIKCDICGFLCKNADRVYIHKKKKHPEALKNTVNIDYLNPEWFCAECKMQFACKKGFQIHMLTLKHSTRDQWRFECVICQRKFPTKPRLEEHVNSQHIKKYIFKCDKCDKAFMKAFRLKVHVAVVHDKQPVTKPFVCHLCGAAFKIQKSLQEHLFKHSGERPYACPLCPATFSYSAALFTHNKLKHLKIKPKWYQKNRKRGNMKEKKDAEGIDEDSRVGDTERAEDGDTGGTEMEDTEWTEKGEEIKKKKRKRTVK